MGTNRSRARFTARRFAAVLATIGVLVTSSGVALMVTATPANALAQDHDDDKKVVVCHATDSDHNPYTGIDVSVNAVVSSGHLDHRNNPTQTWKTDGTWNGIHHNAGDSKRDYIASYPGHVLDGNISKSWCGNDSVTDPATASVDWVEPTCNNENTASYSTSGTHVTWSVVTGSATPGTYLKLKATAVSPYKLAGNQSYKYFDHTFNEEQDCTAYDASADVQFTEPQCENENTASYTPTGINVTFEITDGSVAPGATVEITATATAGHAFDNESKTKVFTHTFDAAEICEVVLPPRELTPQAPTFVDPTCTTDPSMGLPEPVVVDIPEKLRAAVGPVITTVDVDGIRYEATGSLVPGGTVDVVATLIDPETSFFAEGADTAWSHTFTVPAGCTTVDPPVADPETVTPVVTPTVVDSGLVGDVVTDGRAQKGLALMVSGMLLLLGAGALGLVRPRGDATLS